MPWVPKSPKPYDFCGCPPCGICYDFVNPRKNKAQEEERINGILYAAQELLGRTPTKKECEQVEDGFRATHARLKVTKEEIPPESEAVELKKIEKVVQNVIKQNKRVKDTRKKLNTKNIDNMDPEEIKKKCVPNAVPDEELLRREMSKATKSQKQKTIMDEMYERVQRQKMEEERERMRQAFWEKVNK